MEVMIGSVSKNKSDIMCVTETLYLSTSIPVYGYVSLFRRPIIPTAHYSDGPLFRQPIIPTTHYSAHKYINTYILVYTGGQKFENLTLILH